MIGVYQRQNGIVIALFMLLQCLDCTVVIFISIFLAEAIPNSAMADQKKNRLLLNCYMLYIKAHATP